MSALPKQQLPIQESEAEVIYLVVPPTIIAPQPIFKPYSLSERISLWMFDMSRRTHSAREKGLALAFAFFVTALVGFWAYNLKSAFGVDIFPHQHLENFVPLPGWQR